MTPQDAVDYSGFEDDDLGDGELAAITRAVRSRNLVARELNDAEATAKALKEALRGWDERDIPAAMAEAGQTKITTADGDTVEVVEDVKASLPADATKRAKGLNYLRESGNGAIIKTDVTLKFGAGEDNVVGDLVSKLKEDGHTPQTKTNVHPGTLSKTIKEMLAEGVDVPLDALGAFLFTKATVKPPKK